MRTDLAEQPAHSLLALCPFSQYINSIARVRRFERNRDVFLQHAIKGGLLCLIKVVLSEEIEESVHIAKRVSP